MGTRRRCIFADEIEQSLLEEYTSSDDSSSSDETDSCGSDDLTVGEVNFAVLQMFSDNFVHNCTRHFWTLFVYFANWEMSILSNDPVHLLLQCVCDGRGLP